MVFNFVRKQPCKLHTIHRTIAHMRFQFVSKTDEHKLPRTAENTNINFIVNRSVCNLFHCLPFVVHEHLARRIKASVLLASCVECSKSNIEYECINFEILCCRQCRYSVGHMSGDLLSCKLNFSVTLTYLPFFLISVELGL